VDPNITNAYFQKVIDGMSAEVSFASDDIYITRLMEVAEIQGSTDGELYAQYVRRSLSVADVNVLENMVERVLSFQQDSEVPFEIKHKTPGD
jgi:hypothetical protein